jgi:hypothetical protein
MTDFLVVAVIVLGIFGFLAHRGNNRGYGHDSDHKGCRDCVACVRPLIQRLFINATWGNIRGPFVAFISTCPQCSHARNKHRVREDGSYLD